MTATMLAVKPTILPERTGGPSEPVFRYSYAQEWLAWIADRQEITQRSYTVCLKCFIQWLRDNGITQPTRNDIIDYRTWLESPHPDRRNGQIITFSADTRARYFRIVKSFFKWLFTFGHYPDVAANVRSPRTSTAEYKRDSFQRDEIRDILGSIDTSTEKGKRDFSMILLAVTCGLRIIEIQRADIGDIETEGGRKRLYVQGKAHEEKDDYVTVEPHVWDAISDYLDARGCHDRNAPLFSAVKSNAKPGGGRLTEPSISRVIKRAMVAAGYDSRRKTAHSLRHSAITFDRKAGASLDEASAFARHSNVSITQRYDHSLNKEKARDSKRVYDYIFSDGDQVDPSARAAEIMNRIPASKKQQALELLEALAE